MKTISSKVPNDLKEQIENYADSRDISRSEAIRRLIEDSLEPGKSAREIIINTVLLSIASTGVIGGLLSLPPKDAGSGLIVGILVAAAYLTYEHGRWTIHIEIIDRQQAEEIRKRRHDPIDPEEVD